MRHVAPTFAFAAFAMMVAWSPATAADAEGANVRVASFQNASGDSYFAASVQPVANDELMKAVRDSAADVVVVVDTSASRTLGSRGYQPARLASTVASRWRHCEAFWLRCETVIVFRSLPPTSVLPI